MATRRSALLKLRLKWFAERAGGSTAIEYALIASGIAMAIAAVLFGVGEAVDGSYQSVVESFPGDESSSGGG